jgi:hypothetical protein
VDRISSGCGVTAGSSEHGAEGGSSVDVNEGVGMTIVGYGASDRLRFVTSLTEDPLAVGARKVRRDRIRVWDKNIRDGISAPKGRKTAHNYFYNNMGAEQPRRDHFECDEKSSHEAQYPRNPLIRLQKNVGCRIQNYRWTAKLTIQSDLLRVPDVLNINLDHSGSQNVQNIDKKTPAGRACRSRCGILAIHEGSKIACFTISVGVSNLHK